MNPFRVRSGGAFALPLALLAGLLVFFVAGVLATLVTHDRHMADARVASTEALFLARGGVERAASGALPAETVRVQPDPADPTRYCDVMRQGTAIVCAGVVTDAAGSVRSRRVLIIPGGRVDAWYEQQP